MFFILKRVFKAVPFQEMGLTADSMMDFLDQGAAETQDGVHAVGVITVSSMCVSTHFLRTCKSLC